MTLAAEVAFRAYGALKGPTDESATGVNDTIMSAILALTGLLLAFSFGTAQGHFDERRQLVVSESNAIGTTLRRQQLLEKPEQAQLLPLMRAYVAARHTAVTDNRGDARLIQAQQQT